MSDGLAQAIEEGATFAWSGNFGHKNAAILEASSLLKHIDERSGLRVRGWGIIERSCQVYDVNSLADFWSWLRLGFLPLLVQHSWAWSEGRGRECEGSPESIVQLAERLG